nr:PREDICTED: oocyte zinc finger protein XlCOF6-like isoform X2 [Latimeria chalumnae]XP_014350794.1 PREDICTED: oocyte zinc finger protein XlCOF6-like isoform X2 [Latimeria chalumnae]|eukprot:XP_006007324.1 PREDICTED: oocyte zinc finger protein XlCOF6-like isoform X2 [Latimeria chalumnae]
MNGCKCQNIQPVMLHLSEESTTSRLYADHVEGIGATFSHLVEMFLVEVYRCKICQFTSCLKAKIGTHMVDLHEQDGRPHSPGCSETNAAQPESDSYSIGDEIGAEAKEHEETIEENLERMSFLLPVYRMLHNMSPESCDMNLSTNSDSLHVAQTCEVSTLFEAEPGHFPLDDPSPVAPVPLPCPAADPVEASENKDEEEAQSEHLMSLGLCRISSIKSQPVDGDVKRRKTERTPEHHRKQKKVCVKEFNPDQCLENSDRSGVSTSKRKYFCSLCSLKFKSKDLYETHIICHDGSTGFKCVYCSSSMNDWKLMERHLQNHQTEKGTYECSACQKVFKSLNMWKMHKHAHQRKTAEFRCSQCPSSYSSQYIRDLHMECHYSDIFKCLHCDFTDATWNRVYKHLCTHDCTVKPSVRTKRDKTFSAITKRKEHTVNRGHARPFPCPSCGQSFKHSRQLSKHCRDAHQEGRGKQRRSELSQKGFAQAGSEEVARIRKTSKEFACNICHRKCCSKLALQRHMGIHTGVKPFHCQHCEYTTRLKASLIQHMRVHTGEKPFKCDRCPYASIDMSSLRRHSRTHTSERPYKCQLCSYSCIQKKSLDVHVRRHHTGETYGCSFCCYSSPDKQLLQKHLKKHHAEGDVSLGSTP